MHYILIIIMLFCTLSCAAGLDPAQEESVSAPITKFDGPVSLESSTTTTMHSSKYQMVVTFPTILGEQVLNGHKFQMEIK